MQNPFPRLSHGEVAVSNSDINKKKKTVIKICQIASLLLKGSEVMIIYRLLTLYDLTFELCIFTVISEMMRL